MEQTPTQHKAKPYNQKMKGGKTWTGFRSRLTYVFDPELGRVPAERCFYGSTADEANKKMRNFLLKSAQEREVQSIPAARQTLGQYTIIEYLPYLKNKVAYKAYENRKRYLTKHLLTHAISKIPLRSLKPQHIEEFFRGLIMSHISLHAQSALKTDASIILRMVRHYLPKNHREYLAEVHIRTPRSNKPIFDGKAVMDAIYDESKPLEARVFAAFLFVTRCRPSEQFALEKPDVRQNDDGTITVLFSKAIRQTEDGYRTTPGTKTEQAGCVTVGQPLAGLLGEWLRRPAALSSLLVFPNRDGNAYNSSSFRKTWRRLREALGLPGWPFYALKSSGIVYAAERGVTSSVQRLVTRHTSTRMIDEVYAKHSPTAQLIAMEPFRRSKGSQER